LPTPRYERRIIAPGELPPLKRYRKPIRNFADNEGVEKYHRGSMEKANENEPGLEPLQTYEIDCVNMTKTHPVRLLGTDPMGSC
jgi:hypothetical protein